MVPIAVEEPTVRMTFGVNKSPLAGREGKFLTTRMIRDRLMKELDRNVALRVEETESSDVYEVRPEVWPRFGIYRGIHVPRYPAGGRHSGVAWFYSFSYIYIFHLRSLVETI